MSAVTYQTMPGTTSPNGLPRGTFYRYRGTGADVLEPPAPQPGGRTGPRRTQVSRRILEALAGLGGEASTTEIRKALEKSGFVIAAPRQVPDALHRLAKRSPPAVTAVGDSRGGFGRVQRWRLQVRVCAACGEQFTPRPGKRNRQRTCSRGCFRDLMAQPCGTEKGTARLDDEKVREIRALLAAGVPAWCTAGAYGISKAQVSAIRHRRKWAHVPEGPPACDVLSLAEHVLAVATAEETGERAA